MFENTNIQKVTVDRSQEAMQAAAELASEMLPRLRAEFPLAADKLEEYLSNGFIDTETGREFDPGERLAAIQAVMDQRDQFDRTELVSRMEAVAQGKDYVTGEGIHSGGTPQ